MIKQYTYLYPSYADNGEYDILQHELEIVYSISWEKIYYLI